MKRKSNEEQKEGKFEKNMSLLSHKKWVIGFNLHISLSLSSGSETKKRSERKRERERDLILQPTKEDLN